MNVLHIEQSVLIKRMTQDVVEGLGFNYFQANCGEGAFDVLRNQKIDFVITGLEFSDISGEALMREISVSEFRDIPVIVLTSRDDMEIRKKLFDLGVVDYIVKDLLTEKKLKTYIETFESRDEIINKMVNRPIAVLDDSILVNTLIKNIFDLHGIHNIDTFTSAEDLLASDKEYALYILDLILPGISGEEVLITLRQKAKNSIIILISSISNYKTISNILSSGADDYIMKPFDASVFMARIKAHSRNFILREELEHANAELEKAAITDGLTNVYNHRYIVGQVECEVERSKRYGTPLSILLLDIDNFKNVNDTFGHQVGDIVLRDIAAAMKEIVRSSDCVGRYGGEEFMVVLPGTDCENAKIVGEKIRSSIENLKFSHPCLSVTVSGGGAYLQNHSSAHLIRIADEGLYRAKSNGKNQICFVEEE